MKASTNRRLRQTHNWLGLLFAPAILLFAISGALQTFRLQEVKGYGGTPPGWIVWIASVHKDQVQPRPKADKPKPDRPAGAAPAKKPPQPSALPLKIFVGIMSIGLVFSTLLGCVVALGNRAARRTSLLLLAAGTGLPLALLFA